MGVSGICIELELLTPHLEFHVSEAEFGVLLLERREFGIRGFNHVLHRRSLGSRCERVLQSEI